VQTWSCRIAPLPTPPLPQSAQRPRATSSLAGWR
jgi:hypothetical protein